MIQFQFAPDKFASAVAFFVQRIPGLTKHRLSKLLYFADKEHLLRYGFPITGDTYYALKQGHIPGHLASDRREFCLENPPDMRVFSRSEVAVLERIISEFGDRTAWHLERKSRNEPSWKKTAENARCDFAFFFEGHPEATPILEALTEEDSDQSPAPSDASTAARPVPAQ